MSQHAVIAVLILFQVSILTHIRFLAGYFSTKSNRDYYGFLATLGSNFVFAIILSVIVMKLPETVRSIRMEFLQVIEAGILFFYFLILKILITVRVVTRMFDKNNYHLSYFGKKVYSQAVVTKKELAVFYVTLPFTILFGAIFLVKVFR